VDVGKVLGLARFITMGTMIAAVLAIN